MSKIKCLVRNNGKDCKLTVYEQHLAFGACFGQDGYLDEAVLGWGYRKVRNHIYDLYVTGKPVFPCAKEGFITHVREEFRDSEAL